jgi:error-prone DNA polymerase
MTDGREVVEDYRAIQLSLRAHPLPSCGPSSTGGDRPLRRSRPMKDGRRDRGRRIVLIRQRPGKGNVTFITIEDETGIANIIVWQRGSRRSGGS